MMRAKDNRRGMILRGAVAATMVGFLVAACSADIVPEDVAVDRQIDLPIGDSPAPELSDVGHPDPNGETVAATPPPPATSSPVRRTPAVEPTPDVDDPDPEPMPVAEPVPELQYVTLTAPAGAELEVELLDEISTRNNQPGDTFVASITRPVIEGDMVLVPINSLVHGEITAVQKSGGNGEEAVIKLRFIDVVFNGESWPMTASVVEANPQTQGRYSTGDKAARAGAGAIAGGILGRVIGGNSKGTVIGAVVGAAAGTAITLATEDVDAVLEAGSILRLRLDEPLVFKIPNPIG